MDTKKPVIRKLQCSFSLLQSWYESLYGAESEKTESPKKRKTRKGRKLLVVIIPDFEGFSDKLLQNFILIVR